jgi:hypothetical protein
LDVDNDYETDEEILNFGQNIIEEDMAKFEQLILADNYLPRLKNY